jgi:hypothetical protein
MSADAQKRRSADFIGDSSQSFDHARPQARRTVIADKVKQPNIMWTVVMVPVGTLDVADTRPLMVGHVE